MTTQSFRRPPGPRGRRLGGNTYDYDRDRLGFLQKCGREYGDVFTFSDSTIVVSDPALIRELFARTNTDFRTEAALFGGEDTGALMSGIAGWMRARRRGWRGMTPAVTRAHGARLVEAFDATLRDLAGREFDVIEVMRDYTGRMVTDFCLGPGAEEIAGAVDRLSGLAVTFMESSLTFPKWLPLPRIRKERRAAAELRAALAEYVRRRRAAPHAEPRDLLDLLLAETEAPLSDADICKFIEVTLLASYGSPGAALTWIVHELATRPAVIERVRAEAAELQARTGALTDETGLPYTAAFVKEVLRLYPPTWLMGREVVRPCALGPWQLRPGQEVMLSPFVVHRDPRWWDVPDELRPERWLDAARGEATSQVHFPFGAGPRICVGLGLGMYQLVTATAQLAAHHTVRLESTDASPVPRALLVPRSLRARITPRGSAEGAPGAFDAADVR